MNSHLLFILLYIFFINSQLKAEFLINFPVERSVFQRVNNMANIPLIGKVPLNILFLEYNLENQVTNQSTGWLKIKTRFQSEDFNFKILNVATGWYTLKLKVTDNNFSENEITIQNVGVGEVFIIAGQSNAQGGRPPDGGFYTSIFFGAQDIRVNCIDRYYNAEETDYAIPVITKINNETNIAPAGRASWCWAKLGDLIANAYQVPVLFINAAIGATNIQQWYNGSLGLMVYDEISNRTYSNGWPYAHLKNSLNYYANLFGVRTILWHQGEGNTPNFGENGNNFNSYTSQLIGLINNSRLNFNNNMSWVVARVSRFGDGYNNNLKTAQTFVGQKPGFNTFLGPDTDEIQPSAALRDANVHFRGTGLVDLANAWFQHLDSNFWQNSTPIYPNVNVNFENGNFSFNGQGQICENIAINSGNWDDPKTWECQKIPDENAEITINENVELSISNDKTVKSINLLGTIIFTNNSAIHLSE